MTVSGYSADPFHLASNDAWYPELFTGRGEKQAGDLDPMCYDLRNSSFAIESIANAAVRDGDLWQQGLREPNDDVFNRFYQCFREIGIYDGAGDERPGR